MHEPRAFTVSIPPAEVMLYRLITDPDVGADDYRANSMIEGKERLWPKFGEDWVTFLGISTFEHDWQAVSLAQSVNERIARRGDSPRWTHVQAFYVDGHRGHAYAREGDPEGHHSAWGPPGEFYSSGEAPLPIPTA